jgi:hypothetical protein
LGLLFESILVLPIALVSQLRSLDQRSLHQCLRFIFGHSVDYLRFFILLVFTESPVTWVASVFSFSYFYEALSAISLTLLPFLDF